MAKVRIIPCLDLKDGWVVKGKQFSGMSDVSEPQTLLEYYSRAGADELFLYDIGASAENRGAALDFLEQYATRLPIPIVIGGGVRSLADFSKVLNKGAAKVSINSAAVQNPGLIREAAMKFGSELVVLSIDAKQVDQGNWHVFLEGGQVDTGRDVVEWALEGVRLGAGELVINSIDQDGMKAGYDLPLLKNITAQLDVPVIASGGAGQLEHFAAAILEAGVQGVLAASVFHFRQIEISQLKQYLKDQGIEVTSNEAKI